MDAVDLLKDYDDAMRKGDFVDFSTDQPRPWKEILQEFKDMYPGLQKAKMENTLVFDTCIHSGDSMSPVLALFDESGFSNVYTGIVADRENRS
jgi:hypothetical protein